MIINNKHLNNILIIANGEDHPGDVWFIETIEELVAEIRRLNENNSEFRRESEC